MKQDVPASKGDVAARQSVPKLKLFEGWKDVVKTGRALRKQGILNTLRLVFNIPIDRRFDRACGIETCGVIQLSELAIESKDKESGIEYVGTHVTVFRSLMAMMPQDLCEYVFVDYGSGEGRVLFLASQYNFKKIIGIEFSEELHEHARKNLESYQNENQKCSDIELVCANARDFVIPNEKCIIYFFNPFKEPLFSSVLKKIEACYQMNPRTLYFIYNNPVQRHAICNLKFMRRVQIRNLLISITSPHKAAIYRSQP